MSKEKYPDPTKRKYLSHEIVILAVGTQLHPIPTPSHKVNS